MASTAEAVKLAQAGLEALHSVHGLEGYHLFHAARGALTMELGNRVAALEHFRKAKSLAPLPTEREFIDRRILECEG